MMSDTDETLKEGSCAGVDVDGAGNYFVTTYPPFSIWNNEGIKAYQAKLSEQAHLPTPLGIYLHIPFCAVRCDYCYYLSYSNCSGDKIDNYLAALKKECALYEQSSYLKGRELDFLYFGGGTPSLLSVDQLGFMMEVLQSSFSWDRVREVTFECAPKSVTEDKLKCLHDAGVTRISLGVQQMDDEVLSKSGRIHRVEDVLLAYQKIMDQGFAIVNLDLISGLPAETSESFNGTLNQIVDLDPDSITIYQLEIPFNTPLYNKLRKNPLADAPLKPWSEKHENVYQAFDYLGKQGYSQRSAYAVVKDKNKHRFLYQEEQYRGCDLLGLGASSISYLGGVHHQSSASMRHYVSDLESGRLPLYRAHSLSADERMIREFVLQLKLGEVELSYFTSKFAVDPSQYFAEALGRLSEKGWVSREGNILKVTDQGLPRVDELIPLLYLHEHHDIRYT